MTIFRSSNVTDCGSAPTSTLRATTYQALTKASFAQRISFISWQPNEVIHDRALPPTLVRGTVVTMDPQRTIITDGAVAIVGETITAVGSHADLAVQYHGASTVGSAGSVVTPGYVNAHQHFTG